MDQIDVNVSRLPRRPQNLHRHIGRLELLMGMEMRGRGVGAGRVVG